MRLWHQKLIPYLDRQRLLGQHRECCALRGAGWGRPHATVNYVFDHEPAYLVAYHWLVLDEMLRRGYNPDKNWWNVDWRGNTIGGQPWCDYYAVQYYHGWATPEGGGSIVYPEHNTEYLKECINLLKEKNAPIDFKKAEEELLNGNNL